MCDACRRQHDADRLLWQTIRRALLMIAAGIQKRYAETDDTAQKRRAA